VPAGCEHVDFDTAAYSINVFAAGGCEHVDFDTAAYSINVFAPAG